MAKKNNKITVFYVVAFTIIIAIAAGIICFFGFGDNTACKRPDRCHYTYIDLEGNHYTLNSDSFIKDNKENGQRLYKAVDGTYIARVATEAIEYHEYKNDSNGNQYCAGVSTVYDYEWRVVDESWDVDTINLVENITVR